MGQETSKYDNQKYTGATRLDDGETYDTYRDKNKVERYDDSKNKRTLLPTFSAKKIQPPAVLAKDRAEENRPKSMGNFAKGGKVGKVMGEFKSGALKSSSGQKVTNRKQAMAIAMSEAGKSKMKKFAAGGKTDKRSFASGDVFSNYDVGKDPFLNSRKGGTFTDKEMKDGLTKEEIMRKTTPKETPKAKKYAAGGKVGESKKMVKKEMAFMKKKGAPKSMIKHEEKEAKGMKRGGGVEVKGYKKGGMIDGCAVRGKTKLPRGGK